MNQISLQKPVKFLGHLSCPFSRKTRAYLRYKNIPHQFIRSFTPEGEALPKPKIPIITACYLPEDGYSKAHIDSTPLIRYFEGLNTMTRPEVIPNQDKALKFVNNLLEDYSDEWLVKYMANYKL